MKFSRKSSGRLAGLDVIAAEFTPEEKSLLRRWLETTLELEFRAGLGHPLEGFIDFLIDIPDADCIEGAREALEGDETHQELSGKDFRTLTQLGALWEDKSLTRLDEKARENDRFLAKERYPKMREYVLSAAYQYEMKVFSSIVPCLRQAHREIYPYERTVVEVDFKGRRTTEP